MLQRSTWLHLRIPFSFFLLPVFLFSLATSSSPDNHKTILVFFILHFFLYPASNAYNSYFDKDKESIGGLKKPPPVTTELYWVALVLDGLSLLLGLLISWQFSLMLLIYGLVSKAYSHPDIRLKKYPIIGWLAAGIFQGSFTFAMVYLAINDVAWGDLADPTIIIPAGLSTLLLWGSYPMTQVYQHGEDGRRGDQTLSIKLGILGTFYFTAFVFLLANLGFIWYFKSYYSWNVALVFQLFLVPILVYFFGWLYRVRRDISSADYRSTMRLNLISSLCLNLFFGGLWLYTQKLI
ncbi:MAG: UbiA family prenyltransferase [Cyclobacteriaceae bacterium]